MKRLYSRSFKSKNTFREEKDKWVNLENILSRGGPQVGDTDFTLQVFGVYSLPELYSKLLVSMHLFSLQAEHILKIGLISLIICSYLSISIFI